MTRSRAGRPSHVPTDDTRNLVESLSGFGIPQDEIARLVGIAPKTLRFHYADQIELGSIVQRVHAEECSFGESAGAEMSKDRRANEVYPGPAWTSEAGRHDFIRRATDSFHHPTGPCRLGDVVDGALRVKGIAGLRVIDASVLPGLPAAMSNAGRDGCCRESQRPRAGGIEAVVARCFRRGCAGTAARRSPRPARRREP